MSEPTITCPKCDHEIKLTESLAAPLIGKTRQEFERLLAEKDRTIAARENAVRDQQAKLATETAALEETVAQRLVSERERIAGEEAVKAKRLAALEIASKSNEVAELQAALAAGNQKLAEAQKAQAELLRKERALDDAKREMELNIQKGIGAGLESERAKAKLEAEEAMKLRVSEKDQIIASMQNKIEDLKRKAEQGSQQLQGEVLELELESLLKTKFPRDIIEPVAKGEFGGDLIQRVVNDFGQTCGVVLWELKRTKSWNKAWPAKLREDQRRAEAHTAVMVSTAIPDGVSSFGFVEGIWVSEFKCAIAVALALRHSLIEVQNVRLAGEGQQTKMELVYRYMTGQRFRQRIEAVVEKFTDMQKDLDRERKAMNKLWAKRELQIRGVIESTMGLFGDLQGIAGNALPDIEALELLALEDQRDDESEAA